MDPIRKVILLIPIILIAICCKKNNEQSYAGETFHHADSLVSEPIVENVSNIRSLDYAKSEVTLNDSLQFYPITRPSAVVLLPDTSRITEEGIRFTEIAVQTLRNKEITVYMDLTYKQYLLFKGKESYTLDNQKLKESWGIILFNGRDNPVLWSGTNITFALDSIF